MKRWISGWHYLLLTRQLQLWSVTLCPVFFPLPLLSNTNFIVALDSMKTNPALSQKTHFFPHSDLTGRGEPSANTELPFERCGDTQNCLLNLHLIKKLFCNLLTPPLLDSSLATGMVMYGKENSMGTDVHLLHFSSVCKYVTSLCKPSWSVKCNLLCLLTGVLTASSNFLAPLWGKEQQT